MLGAVALSDDVARIAGAARRYRGAGEPVEAVLAVEPGARRARVSRGFRAADGTAGLARARRRRDAGDEPRARVRDAASIAALVEVAEESADGDGSGEPRVASPALLDSLGADAVGALQGALPAVEELAQDVEANYKLELT